MNTIASNWEALAKILVKPEMPEEQVVQMRRLFYCGAMSYMLLVHSLGESKVSEKAAIAMLDGWRSELKQFETSIVGNIIEKLHEK